MIWRQYATVNARLYASVGYEASFSQASIMKTNAPHKLCLYGKSKASEAGRYSWDKSLSQCCHIWDHPKTFAVCSFLFFLMSLCAFSRFALLISLSTLLWYERRFLKILYKNNGHSTVNAVVLMSASCVLTLLSNLFTFDAP